MFNYESIPAPIRTILNVTAAGALTVGLHDLDVAGSLGAIPWQHVGSDVGYIAIVGLVTAMLRALNPFDTAYGVGAKVAPTSIISTVIQATAPAHALTVAPLVITPADVLHADPSVPQEPVA
jgi:hypothetical protein